jgi:hypothetical protein
MSHTPSHVDRDISSAEEETQKRKINRSKTWLKGIPKSEQIRLSVPIPLLPVLNRCSSTDSSSSSSQSGDEYQQQCSSAMNVESTDIEFPQFHELGALNQLYPHLEQSKIVCHKSTSKKITKTEASSALLATSANEDIVVDTQQDQDNDPHFEILREKMNELTTPEFYVQGVFGSKLTQEQLTGHLRSRQMMQSLIGATLMQELLHEAGEFYHPALKDGEKRVFPSCVPSSTDGVCYGMTFHKMKFMSMMNKHEYDNLLVNNVMPPTRPCIVCLTHTLVEAVLADRAMNMICEESATPLSTSVQNTSKNEVVASSVIQAAASSSSNANGFYVYGRKASIKNVYQVFRNKMDCVDGFFRKYMLCDIDAADIFVDPILKLNLSTVKVTQVKLKDGTMRSKLDISMMIWKQKTSDTPKVGELMSVF